MAYSKAVISTRLIPLRAWQAAAAVGMAAFTLHVGVGLGGPGSDHFFDRWLYCGLLLFAAGACVARGVLVSAERAAWLFLAVGLTSWTIGDIYYTFAFAGVDTPPFPSIADGFYLAFYPLVYTALVLLVRARVPEFNGSVWLDGLLATLAAAALGATVLVEAVLRSTEGTVGVVVTNLAYPIGDTLLLALTVGIFALTGWRPGRHWAFIGAGFVAAAVADGIFLFQISNGSYSEGGLLDALWPASMLLLAQAAWQKQGARAMIGFAGRRTLAAPLVCGLIGIGVLAYGRFHDLNLFALALAIATLLAVIVRTGMTFEENQRILGRIRHQAVTDALTGLGNRRKLLADLGSALAVEHVVPTMLVIYDLDGFKRYNDSFGHPAGDALLERLGAKLAASVERKGESYRLGGDEFCVLAQGGEAEAVAVLDATFAALSESGEAFRIEPSFGVVFLPDEAAEPAPALGKADQRLYRQKSSKYATRDREDLLLRALYERDPALKARARLIGDLSFEVGRELSLDPAELEHLRRAAELHDVGTVALPDEILRKPGPLNAEEWAFIKRHTELGQRILEAAPTLHHEAELMRSTHERWDGEGYPDRLAGEAIPLGSRIISACAAFAAMTCDRPYRAKCSTGEALAELRRFAGTQFDPNVAEVLCRVVNSSRVETAAA